jgi:signal transduction histidine kinase
MELFAVNATDVLSVLDQSPDQLHTVLQSASDLPSRSTRLADLQRSYWPGATLHACLLRCGEETSLAVLGEDGKPSPDWFDRLQPHNGWEVHFVQKEWMSLLGESSRVVQVQIPDGSASCHGLLALQLPKNVAAEEAHLATRLLRSIARTLAHLLTSEIRQRELSQFREDLAEQERLANTGELAGVVAHELTNFLNVLLLHLTVVGYQLPESFRPDIEQVARQGKAAAEVVRKFQDYRHGQRPQPRPVDLNETLVEVVGELVQESPAPLPLRLATLRTASRARKGEAVPVQMMLGCGLLPVRGTRMEVRRLLRFLVANATRAAVPQAGQVFLRTEVRDKQVILRIEDTGASIPEDELPFLFDLSHAARMEVDGLELAACKVIAQHIGGTIHPELRPGGGLSMVVTFSPVA